MTFRSPRLYSNFGTKLTVVFTLLRRLVVYWTRVLAFVVGRAVNDVTVESGATCVRPGEDLKAGCPQIQRGWHNWLAFDDKLQGVAPYLDAVTMLQQSSLDRRAIELRAIGAVQVLQPDALRCAVHHGMGTTDHQVVDHDIVLGATSQRGTRLRQGHLAQVDAIDRNDQPRHRRLLNSWQEATIEGGNANGWCGPTFGSPQVTNVCLRPAQAPKNKAGHP